MLPSKGVAVMEPLQADDLPRSALKANGHFGVGCRHNPDVRWEHWHVVGAWHRECGFVDIRRPVDRAFVERTQVQARDLFRLLRGLAPRCRARLMEGQLRKQWHVQGIGKLLQLKDAW